MTNLSFHIKRLWTKYLLDYERERHPDAAMSLEETDPVSTPNVQVGSKNPSESILPVSPRKRCRAENIEGTRIPDTVPCSGIPRMEISQHHPGGGSSNNSCGKGRSHEIITSSVTAAEQSGKMHPNPDDVSSEPTMVHNTSQVVQQWGNSLLLLLPAAGPSTNQTFQDAAVVNVDSEACKGESEDLHAASGHGGIVHEVLAQPTECTQIDASSTPTALVAGNVEVIGLEEFYKRQVSELQSKHEEKVTELNGVIKKQQQRIHELECILQSTSATARETRWYLNTLLPATVQPESRPADVKKTPPFPE